jgi:NitT/TauT family transport system substrate-binding protein
MIRKLLFVMVVLALSVGVTTAQDDEMVDVVFGLDWAFVGQHAPFFTALDQGFWAEEGLNVEIVRGFGSSDAVQKVASGAVTIGYGDTSSLVVARTEDVEVKLIGMLLSQSPAAVFYNVETNPIEAPEDLEGMVIGAAAGDAVRRVFPAFADITGIDMDSVTFETIGYEIYAAQLLSGQINALAEYDVAKPNYDNAAAESDIELGVLKFSDFGFDVYSNGFLATEALIDEQPEVIEAFLRGVYRGFNYAYENPDEAVDIMLSYESTLNPDVIRAQFLLDRGNILVDDVIENGWGYIDAEKMANTIDIMTAAYELETSPAADDMYTNEFLPSPDDVPVFVPDDMAMSE